MDSNRIGSATDRLISVQAAKQQDKTAKNQAPPAPGSALAVPAETARAEVNAAALMTAMMAPTSDGIYAIGAVAVKVTNAIKSVASIGKSWGFWAIALATSLSFGISSAPLAFAHGNGHGYGHDKHGDKHSCKHSCKHNGKHECDDDDDTGPTNPGGVTYCPQEYDRLIEATEIKGGKHVTFSTADLVALDAPNVRLDGIFLNIAVRGKKSDLKKVELALNGVRAMGHHGRAFWEIVEDFAKRVDKDANLHKWWKSRYWRFYIKHSFYWHRDSLVVSFDLTGLTINAAEQFNPWFKRLIHSRGTMTFSVGGPLKVVDAEIRVLGAVDMPCEDGEPGPTPTVTPTPTPTPTAVAPETVIESTSPQESPTNSTTKTISFTSNQPNVSFYCSVDQGPDALCSSPHVLTGVGNGAHKFKVRAVSAAGLEDQQGAEHVWAVDTIAPDVSVTTVTPAGAVTNSSSISIGFSSNENSEFQCSIDGGEYVACQSPMSYDGLGEGLHEVDVIGVDDAGNTSLAPARYMWRIDQTAPVASIAQVEPAASTTNKTEATFSFAANESSSFECSLDGASYVACVSPYLVNGPEEGQHTMLIRAIDVAGNRGGDASYAWTVDATAPALALGSVVPAQGLSNARAVSVEFNTTETASYLCSYDGGEAAACVSPFTAPVTQEGAHSLVIVATDLAGNVSAPVQLAWTMDFSSPQISFAEMIPSAATYINSASLTVNITATEPVEYASKLDGIDLNQTSSPIVLSNLSEGNHSLVLTAVDRVGNPANTITHEFTVDLTLPVVTVGSTAVQGVSNQTSNTIAFSANEQGTFECNFNGSGFSACASPMSFAGLIEGTHIFQVRAIDQAGNVSETQSVSWTVDQTAPHTVITSATPSAAVIGSGSISVAFSVNDSGATSQCSFDGGSFLSCSSPFSTSNLGNGSHTVQIRSIDAAGNVESQPATYSFAVDASAPTVALSSSVPMLTNNVNASFTFSASENATFDCTLDGVTQMNCVSPLTYNDLVEGTHRFSVVATDSYGNVGLAVSFNWTIDTTAPITSLTATQAENNGSSISFMLSASELNATYVCSLDGAAFSACSSGITFTDLAAGNHIFMARAVDGAGNLDAFGASHSFSVAQALTTTLTNVTPSAAITPQTSITFEFTASVAEATFECSLDGAAYSGCVSPKAYTGLAGGSHNFNVRAVMGDKVDTNGASHAWTIDGLLPLPTSITVSVTSSSATLTWTTNKPTTTMLYWGVGTDVSRIVAEDNVYKTTHTVTLTGLSRDTIHSYRMAGHDQAGNFMFYSRRTFKTSP